MIFDDRLAMKMTIIKFDLSISKFSKYIVALIVELIIFQNICTAQDIALKKSYVFSSQPDYSYSDRSADKTSLTDGIYSTGTFWTRPTTVGWQSGKDVSITIDLEKILPIDKVTFNTVRAVKSGIYFPQSIFVFISNDNKTFRYVGDAAEDPQNLPGNNEVRKFSLDSIGQSARYVQLTVAPQCPYVFCDEVEIFQGKKNDNLAKGSFSKNSLMQVVDSLKLLGYEHKTLTKAVEEMKKFSTQKNHVNQEDVFRLSNALIRKNLTNYDLKVIKEAVVTNNVKRFQQKFDTPFILEKYNPWDTLNEFRDPEINSINLRYVFFVCDRCAQYGAFAITNSSTIPKKFDFNILNGDALVNKIDLYIATYVPSLYYERILDPMSKVNGSITINPGVSEMFIFKISGSSKGGSARSSIIISSNKNVAKINIETTVVKLGQSSPLNVNVWAYLNKPMLATHKEEAIKDLELHQVNTFVIPPEIVPNMSAVNYDGFIKYLGNLGEIKNILLSMGYSSLTNRRGFKNWEFMSDDWKMAFTKWYENMKMVVEDNCSSNTQIYLYPYDEIASSSNIKDFTNLILWAKKTIPGIKFYATLNNRTALDLILPLVDVAQIAPSLGGNNKLPPHDCEIWVYSGRTPSRAQSPYGYYRLMAWDAFVNDYKGIGFWNYADERNGNALNLISDSLPNLAGSYSVIYNNSDGSIISSRRWEAFRLGIEDYSILQAYSKKFGIQNAKALATQVVNSPEDLGLADSIRNKMFIALLSGE